jgi:cation diffusion facilitator CzcD-associated flavoprotein CzcO
VPITRRPTQVQAWRRWPFTAIAGASNIPDLRGSAAARVVASIGGMNRNLTGVAGAAPATGKTPSVAIIGAGIAGLTSVKALQDYGIPCTVFEAGDRIGGNWAFKNPNGRSSAYRSLHIDTSREGMSFRDFPMDPSYSDFPHHAEIYNYLQDYVETFGIRDAIRFDSEVTSARRLMGGGWELEVHGQTQYFDLLVVGNGHHWDARYPTFPGQFDGPVIHSHYYIDPTEPLDLRDKRVLVVGIGNSAVDITSELSRKGVSAEVFISTRSGAYVIPKFVLGRPVDRLAPTSPYLPFKLQRVMSGLLPRLFSGRMENFGLPKPNHHFYQAHATLSSELLLRLGQGDAKAKPNVTELLGDRVRFADGSIEEIDAIIYATGYNIRFPFFDEGFISAPDNQFPLYKRMFKPEIDDLVFIGFAQPLPTLFTFTETQAKLMARYAAGLYALPNYAEMQRDIEKVERFNASFVKSPRHTMEIDGYLYEHDFITRELPAGLKRARLAPPEFAGRTMVEAVSA